MSRARTERIAVTGAPHAAGVFARTISQVLVVSTDEPGSAWDEPSDEAATDFGRVPLPGGLALHLLLPPSGDSLALVWPTLAEDLLGHVLVVAGDGADELRVARGVLDLVGDTPPVVVAVAGLVSEQASRVRAALDLPSSVPLVSCDMSDRASVKAALLTLLESVLSGLQGSAAAA